MRKVYASLLLMAGLFVCTHLSAQHTDIYLKVAGVDGGVTKVGFEKSIEALSYSQGAAGCTGSISSTSFKDGACKAMPSGFNFMTVMDQAQIPLKKLLYTSKLIPSVTVSFVKAGNDGNSFVYYLIRLENVLIGSLQESGSSEAPIFSLEFIPQKFSWIQYDQKDDGSIQKIAAFGWDVSKNAEFTPAN